MFNKITSLLWVHLLDKVVDAMNNNDQCHDFQQYNTHIFLIFEDVDFDVLMFCPCESILHVYLTKSTIPTHGNLLACYIKKDGENPN